MTDRQKIKHAIAVLKALEGRMEPKAGVAVLGYNGIHSLRLLLEEKHELDVAWLCEDCHKEVTHDR